MKHSPGFTMIELLVVVLVIGILAGIMVPVAMSVYNKGKITETRGFIKVLETAMEAYKSDMNVYPEHTVGGPTFLYYLLETGRNSPYIDRTKLQTSSNAIPAPENIDALDSWGEALYYYRAPILGKPGGGGSARFKTVAKTSELSAELAKFLGNDQSFNLWSKGADGEDDSSDHPSQAAEYSADHAGGDPPDACDDDVINWK